MSRTIDITNGLPSKEKVTEIIFAPATFASGGSTLQACKVKRHRSLGNVVISDNSDDKIIISSADHARKLIQALELAIEEEMFQ